MTVPITSVLGPKHIPIAKAMVFSEGGLHSRIMTTSLRFNGDEIVKPKRDPSAWANMLEQSSRLSRAIRVLARNTVGMGWEVVPAKLETELNRLELSRYRRERDELEALLDRPNAEQSLAEILECYKIDEEGTGTGYLEAVRNQAGRTAALYHAPSLTMRVATKTAPSGHQLFAQKRSSTSRLRYFAPFGSQTGVNPDTGEVSSAPFDKRASEIIRSRIYSPHDDWYGEPRFVPAAPAIMSTRLGQQWNINFLRNSAHVPYAVIVEGGNLDSTSMKLIQTFIEREGKGVSNAGRVLLLQPDLENLPPEHQKNVKIKLEKIAVGLSDDGGFLKLREADNEDIREVLGMAKIMLGTFTDANKSNAVIALRVTVQQEIEPEIQRKEHMLNNTLVRDLGMTVARIRLKRPRVLDALQAASLTTKLMSALSLNELRRIASELLDMHLPPVSGKLADIPRGFFNDAKMLMQAEELESKIVERVRAVVQMTGGGDPVDVTPTSGESEVRSLLPDNFDNVVSLVPTQE